MKAKPPWNLDRSPSRGFSSSPRIVTIVAFLTFDSLARILLAPAIYIALETIEGQGQGEDLLKGARLNMV